ncbi:RNA polymerase II transcription elongation factor-domain-containing protein [Cladorrhinum sp. PSN259]|nr:RNA polymerase II transcription elongation factor-domain-containing protein [Cladorrhinum sp. PSN259]
MPLAAMAAIDPTKKYPIILSNELLGKPSKETFTGVKLNHRPTLSSDASPSSSRIKPLSKDAGSFSLTFDDQPGKKYQYNGVRTTDDGKFVLVFDPKRQALVLHRVDSTFHMNVVRTPTDGAETLRKKFPQLDIKDSSTIASSSSSAKKAKPTPKLPSKAKADNKVLTFKPKRSHDAQASAPPPPLPTSTRAKAKPPARVNIPRSNLKKNARSKAAADNKKPGAATTNIALTLPDPNAKPAAPLPAKKKQQQQVSLALPTAPEKKAEPEKKSKKRGADSEDEDEDDDDDFGLTIEYPDAAPTTSNSSTFVTASLNRRFSELNEVEDLREEDLEQHFNHFRNESQFGGGREDEDMDDEGEEIEFEKVPIPEPPQRVVVEEPAVFTFDDGDDSDDEGDGGAGARGGEEAAGGDMDFDDLEAELEAEFDKVPFEEGGGHGSDSEVSEEE